MKKRNRGGFTLTEIITIIAIALIIVGMMVATLVSVADVKRYAKLQESEQQEMQSKLEELMALLNGDWQTDFENTLAEKLAEVDLNLSGEESQTAIAAAVSAALTEYGAAKGGSVGLTGEQLEEIVNRTLAGSLTEAQVESIVKKYSNDTLTSSQIRRIVEQAIENSLTAGQIRQAVDDALTSNAKLSEIDSIIKSISEDVEAIQNAVISGVKGIFTAHGKDIEELSQNPEISKLLNKHIFGRIILLNPKKRGDTECIYLNASY